MAENLNAFKDVAKETQVVDRSKKLKIGIIGTGWIAGAHIDAYKKCDDVEIVAGADLVPGKAEEFFKENGIENARCYPDHKSLLDNEELDAVHSNGSAPIPTSEILYNQIIIDNIIKSAKKHEEIKVEIPEI